MTEPLAARVSSGYCMPKTLCFDMTPSHGGQPYRIFVASPLGDAPEDGWPILYLTDGNACFPFAATAHGIQAAYPSGTNIGHGVIVAIGYPHDGHYDPLRRSWDLSPPPGQTYPPFAVGAPDVVTGGAGQFLDFIEAELKPHIASLFPIDRNRQTLFGHSFGGLFTLYSLFSRPRSFDRYIAVSPAIFWEECCILTFEQQYIDSCSPPGRCFLHLSAGQYEGDMLAPFQEHANDATTRRERSKLIRTASYAEEMAERLTIRAPGQIKTAFETFAGENHMSVLPVSIGRALQIAFALWEPDGRV